MEGVSMPGSDQEVDGEVRSGEADFGRWLELFYARTDSEFALSRTSLYGTHQWAVTLAVGVVAAALGLGTAYKSVDGELPLMAILVAAPLLVRFYVRSCIDYAVHCRWKEIRNATDRYFRGRPAAGGVKAAARAHLDQVVELYYFQWKSPLTLRTVLWHQLRLTYLWPFILLAGAMAWGFWIVGCAKGPLIVGVVVALYLIYEAYQLATYDGLDFAKCSACETSSAQ